MSGLPNFIVLDWRGPKISAQQAHILLGVAYEFPGSAEQGDAVGFSHELCEGTMTCKGNGMVGSYAGTIFSAHLGEHRGNPWTYDFLVRAVRDNIREGTGVWRFPTFDGMEVTEIDMAAMKPAKLRTLRRQ